MSTASAKSKPFLLGICCFFLLFSGAIAQNRVHIGIGYNQSYAQLDSLNYVLGAFNSENTWMEKPLSEIHFSGGIAAHVGADFGGVLLDVGYTMRNAYRKGKGDGSPGEGSQVIQLRYNASTVDIGLGYFALRKPRLRMALGGEMSFGNLNISGRRGNVGQLESQVYGRYINELNFGATAFMHWMIAFQDGVGPGIFIRPYFQFSLLQNDYVPLNRVLRPTEWLSDSQFILGKQSNVGMKVGMFFGS